VRCRGSGPGGLSILSGNTVNAPISVPVTACGIAVAALGQANAGCLGSSAVNPTPQSCHAYDCNGIPPVGCHGTDCTTTPPGGCTTNCGSGGCHTSNCGGTPPAGCQGTCGGGTPPGGTPPGGTTSGHGGTGSGSGGHGTPPGTATVSTTSLPANLPTTGANLLALLLAGGGALVVGTGTVLLARRRQTGEIA